MTILRGPKKRGRDDVDDQYHRLSRYNLAGPKVTTLSSNSVNPRGVIGLLYVPTLDENSLCYNQSREYIPDNVVSRKDLGNGPYNVNWFMPIAPWISAECTLQYLEAARLRSNIEDLRGMLFYVPGNSTERPPAISDPQWNLNDGGSWKARHRFPVYALPPATGQVVVDSLAKYSDMTATEDGRNILEKYESGDHAPTAFRMMGWVGTSREPGNPSLWLFLLIVIASLGGGLIITSILMHWRARRRRERLRRMIVNGEITLGLLGVKKVTVPQDDIDKMPLYIYVTESRPGNTDRPEAPAIPPPVIINGATEPKSESSPAKPTTTITATEVPNTAEVANEAQEGQQVVSNPNKNPVIPKTFDAEAQPSCPICLDDYVSNKTIVRSLPCQHIYHPECIDKFLSRNSSMCPMCKNSALPAGYCPPLITSTMVRRERDIRMRAELDILERSPEVVFRNVRLWWARKRLNRNTQRLGHGSLELAVRRAMVRESAARRNERRESLAAMTRSQRAEVRGRELAGDNEVAGEHVEERPRPVCEFLLFNCSSERLVLILCREKSDKKGIPHDDLRYCVYHESASTYGHEYDNGFMDKRDTRSWI